MLPFHLKKDRIRSSKWTITFPWHFEDNFPLLMIGSLLAIRYFFMEIYLLCVLP